MKNILIMMILVSALFADFVRDGEQVVRDSNTNLMWTDHEVVSKNWRDSIAYCDDLVRNGSVNWRLPNIQELLSIAGGASVLDVSYPNSLNKIFEEGSINDSYWSSTTRDNNKLNAYRFSARYGKISVVSKSSNNKVRCVRDIL